MVLAKAGDKLPLLTESPARFALFDEALVTVTVYVFTVTPSCAVDTILIALPPIANGIAADAEPDTTAIPFTFTVAFASLVVGVTVIVETVLITLTV